MGKTETKNTKEMVLEMEKSNGVYIKKKTFFLKQLWKVYLSRLNKITRGKPQCCK